MHLFFAHVLLWSVCERSAQHWASAASHTGAGHKGHNPYNVHNVFHMSQIKKHIPGGSSAYNLELIQVDGEELFEVEALLQHRSRGNS